MPSQASDDSFDLVSSHSVSMGTDTSATAAIVPPPPETDPLEVSAYTNRVGNEAISSQDQPPNPPVWHFNPPPPLPPLHAPRYTGPSDFNRGRPLRARGTSPDSYFSPSPVPFRRRSSPSPGFPRTHVSTHDSLMFASDSGGQVVRLSPFYKDAYVTAHAAGEIEFRQWFPLLLAAAPESWYAFRTEDIHSAGVPKALHLPPPSMFTHVHSPMPIGIRMPRVCASPALRTQMTDMEAQPALVYLSVQQAIMGAGRRRYYSPGPASMPEMAGQTESGQPIYRVVRSGSRDEAASQAFYNAGANRWSTVFTCVVKDTGNEPRYPLLESYVRARSLEELIESPSSADKVMVFY